MDVEHSSGYPVSSRSRAPLGATATLSLLLTALAIPAVLADHEHAETPYSWDCWIGCSDRPALNCIRDRDLLQATRREVDHATSEVLGHIHELIHDGLNEAADWVLVDGAEFLHENDVYIFRFYSIPYEGDRERLETLVSGMLCPPNRRCDVYISW